jgi:hydroxypyruvate reductase
LRDLQALRRTAHEIFDEALSKVDAHDAVLRAVSRDDSRLRIVDAECGPLDGQSKIYSVAVGKGAMPMALALEAWLGERLTRGVISAPPSQTSLPERWRVFKGGHPLPNSASMDAARAAFDLLREADDATSLIIFLISGGGSAMLEWPRDERVTLEDLRETNRVLVNCGARIAEINAVRRALSAVKGGGLSAAAPRAAQVTLIVSDTGKGREREVASGPTFTRIDERAEVAGVIERHGLGARLPASVKRALAESDASRAEGITESGALRKHFVLLDNESAYEAAAEAARSRGFLTEVARDLEEQPVGEGAAESVSRLLALYGRRGAGSGGNGGVCLISGGEFACPVRGDGNGGRNAETALRCAFEFDERAADGAVEGGPRNLLALCVGTDGVDGNSPAAGALVDSKTIRRARDAGLDARSFLEESDAYTLFNTLGDTIVTGPTGTNVRDLRILLAR